MKKIIEFAREHNMLPEGASVLAAVSGGADSMCLLAFLTENAGTLGITVSAAHFNHLLRGAESDRDEDFVRSYCEKHSIPFCSGRGDVAGYAAEHKLGTEDAARTLRYNFLEETRKTIGADIIATAHNADDNAETVILNLVRGTGLRGLRGIPPVRGRIVRPLLPVTRAEIEDYLNSRGISYITDSTNLEDKYTRNRLRHSVMPVLKSINPRFSESIFRTSNSLRQDEQYLTAAAESFISAHVSDGRARAAEIASLPMAVSSRVIRSVWDVEISACHIEDIIRLCESTSPSARLDIPGGTVYREYGDVVFGGFEHQSFAPVELSLGENVRIPPLNLEISLTETVFDNNIHKTFTDYLFKITEVYGKISIRSRLPGDKIRPAGCGFSKTVKKLLAEKHIPAGKRDMIPVIADGAGVLAVHTIAVSGRAVPAPGDTVYKITFKEC